MTDAAIGPEFARRLRQAPPGQIFYAVVLLKPGEQTNPNVSSLPIDARRRARQEQLRTIPSQATILSEIDQELANHGGRRLSHVDALGGIAVAGTAEGLKALARNDHVRAIIEDQPITLTR